MNSLPQSSTRDEDSQGGDFTLDDTPIDNNTQTLDPSAPPEPDPRLLPLNPPTPTSIPSPEHSDAPAPPLPSLLEPFPHPSPTLPHLQTQAQFYFSSFPGVDNEAPNTAAHTMFRALLAGRVTSESSLAGIGEMLTFRLRLSAMATTLLKTTGIPLPKRRRRCEFDLDKFDDWCDDHPDSIIAKNDDRATDLIFRNVLPDPVRGTNQGRRWNKPHHYLAAGVACDPDVRDEEGVEEAVRRLEKAYKEFEDGERGLEREMDV